MYPTLKGLYPRGKTPVRVPVAVRAENAHAEVFTDEIGALWPVDDHSVGAGSVTFVDERVIEHSPAGESIWAEVTEWHAPHTLSLNWHAGSDEPDPGTDLRVTFDDREGRTLVAVTLSGWEKLPDPDRSAGEYG